jgi:mannosyltransferase
MSIKSWMSKNIAACRHSLLDKKYWWLGILALTILGSILRIANIGYSFNGDDFIIVNSLQGNLSSAVGEIVTGSPYSPLYYVILKIWLSMINSTSEIAVRTLSVAFGTVSIPMLYFVGRLLFDHRISLLAALLLALSPFHIEQASQPKPNTLLVLLVLCALYSFLCWSRDRRKRDLIGFVFFSILGLYTHNHFYFALFAVDAFWLVAWLRTPDRKDWKSWLVANMVWVFSLIPWMPILFGQAERIVATTPGVSLIWGPLELAATFSLGYSGWTMSGMSVDKTFQLSDIPANAPVIIGAIIGFGALLVAGLCHARRNLNTALAVVLLIVPVVVTYILAIVSPVFSAWTAKSLIASSVGYYFLLAVGMVKFPSRRLGTLLGVLVFLLISYSLFNYFFREDEFGRKSNWRNLAGYIMENSRPGDMIGSGDITGLEWYYRGDLNILYFSTVDSPSELTEEIEDADLALGTHPRVWFAEVTRANPDSAQSEALRWLKANCIESDTQRFNPLLVLHLFHCQ